MTPKERLNYSLSTLLLCVLLCAFLFFTQATTFAHAREEVPGELIGPLSYKIKYWFLTVARSIIDGILLTGLCLVVSRALARPDKKRLQPGGWVLLLAGVGIVFDLIFAWWRIARLHGSEFLSFEMPIAAVIVKGVCLSAFCVCATICVLEIEWKACFASSATTIILGYAWWMSGLDSPTTYAAVRIAPYVVAAVAGGMFILCGLRDYRRRVKRDKFHWLGLFGYSAQWILFLGSKLVPF
jgi:hypothetical protein